MEDDLTTAKFLRDEWRNNRSLMQDHTDTLADCLEETFRVVREMNKVGRERQKE
jgi:hypothetical protein